MTSERRRAARARNRARGLPLLHGAPWTDMDNRRLARLVYWCKFSDTTADEAIAHIAPQLQRTRCAIYCKLFALGLVEGPYND